LYPILFEIPNRAAMATEIVVAEVIVGIVCLLVWLALRARAAKGWAVTLFSTGAILVGLHLLLSWFMGKEKPITIYSFGVIIILGFLAGVWFMTRQTERLGFPSQKIFDWAFWLLVTGIVGSRLLFAFLNFETFENNKLEIFRIWNGGLVWYGGLIPAVVVGVWLLRRYKLPVLPICDACAVALMLSLGIGRWACLLAGDDYGARTDLWLGIRFYNEHALVPAELRGVLLHPTQLYMSLNALWLFFIVEWIRRRARYAGEAFAAMLILYAITRAAFIEPFRGDFVERNPEYAKRVAARLRIERAGEGPEIKLARGTNVRSDDGRTGRLLADATLPAGEKAMTVWAITDEAAQPRETPSMLPARRTAPDWQVSRVEGLEGATVLAVQCRWYGSDLPRPPGFVSTSQWISGIVILAGVLILVIARRLRSPGFTEAVAAHEAAAGNAA